MERCPSMLDRSLFEATPPAPDQRDLIGLSSGLRSFGNSLGSIEGADGRVFINAATEVDNAAATLKLHGNRANERATIAMRGLPLQERLGLPGGNVCVAELHSALLREREALRVYTRNDLTREEISDGYSRFGDLLTFMAGQEDIAACIAAHRSIEIGFGMAAAPAPFLHYRNRRPKASCCFFDCLWLEPFFLRVDAVEFI